MRENLTSQVGNFLWREGFTPCDITAAGMVELMNLLSDYYEEGKRLYPEIILTNNFEFFNTISNIEITIDEKALSIKEFKNIVKLCAPLCSNSWVIFIEVKDNRIKYGVTFAELTETTPTIYKQTVGEMKIDLKDCTIAYIRNIGNKTIELSGLKKKVIVSLSLDAPQSATEGEISELSQSICKDVITDNKEGISNYLEKIITETLREGHGNLIGVVESNSCERLKSYIKDGIYLEKTIDLNDLVTAAEIQKDNESSIILNKFGSLIKSMMNHDGITIFTTTGQLVGYHIIIQDLLTVEEKQEIVGGSRMRAFNSMIKANVFEFCFMKSQDGEVKTSKK